MSTAGVGIRSALADRTYATANPMQVNGSSGTIHAEVPVPLGVRLQPYTLQLRLDPSKLGNVTEATETGTSSRRRLARRLASVAQIDASEATSLGALQRHLRALLQDEAAPGAAVEEEETAAAVETANYDEWPLVASVSFTVADPRPPTVELQVRVCGAEARAEDASLPYAAMQKTKCWQFVAPRTCLFRVGHSNAGLGPLDYCDYCVRRPDRCTCTGCTATKARRCVPQERIRQLCCSFAPSALPRSWSRPPSHRTAPWCPCPWSLSATSGPPWRAPTSTSPGQPPTPPASCPWSPTSTASPTVPSTWRPSRRSTARRSLTR